MSEPIEVVEAEVLPPASVGQGFQPGRPKGAKGRVTQELLKSFSDYINEHPDESPVITLINISCGKAFNLAGEPIEVPLSVRASAAGKLLSTFLPSSSSMLRLGDTVNIDARGVEVMATLAATPGYRGLAERMARLRAEAMLKASGRFSDSHIIVAPESQAALEAGPIVTVPTKIPGREGGE